MIVRSIARFSGNYFAPEPEELSGHTIVAKTPLVITSD